MEKTEIIQRGQYAFVPGVNWDQIATGDAIAFRGKHPEPSQRTVSMAFAESQSSPAILVQAWTYGKYALSGATVITTISGLAKLYEEHSAKGKRAKISKRMAEHAMYVQRLEKNLEGIPDPDTSHPGLVASRKRAHQEDLDLIAEYESASEAHKPKHLSEWQRAFLIYLPRTKWGWVAHFLFYGFCCSLATALSLDTADYPDNVVGGAYLVFTYGGMAYIANRWANFTLNRYAAIRPKPNRLPLGIYWYPANSYLGLLAKSFVFLIGMSLACNELPYFYDAHYDSLITLPWTWTSIIWTFTFASYLSVGYFWTKTEYLIGTKAIRAPRMRDVREISRHPKSVGEVMAIAILYLWGVLSLILIAFFPWTVALEAKVSPDGGTALGVIRAFILGVGAFAMMLIIPWIAVFRGFSLFFNLTQPESTSE